MTNEQFAKLFNPNKNDEVIPWIEDRLYSGFSVLRPYKSDLGFIPAITKSGQEDTKVLIKIGLRISSENIEDKLQLFLSVSKHSKYKSSHFGIDFNNSDAPTKESLSESEKSKQPIDLEERERFFISLKPISFYDKKNKKEVTLNDLVDYMYNLHLQTISGRKSIIFKTKLNLREFVCNHAIPTIISLAKKLLAVFGKEIIDDEKDFTVGLFKPFVFKKHINTKYPNSLPFFSSDFRVSLINILWISLSLLAFWFYVPKEKSIGELFTVALVVVFMTIFEFIIPFIIMLFINILIIFRIKLELRPIKFD